MFKMKLDCNCNLKNNMILKNEAIEPKIHAFAFFFEAK